MNMPAQIPWPTGAEWNVKGCEFVDGQWRPKHPDAPPDKYLYREGHEFVDGAWVEKHMSVESDHVGVNLTTALQEHARRTKAGRVQGPQCGYQCFPDDPRRVRLPDASFIRADRVTADVRTSGNCPIAPDFVGEVVSPNDEAEDANSKVHQYFTAGVRLVWLIFPATRSVWVLRSNGTGAWSAGTGELSGEDVITGFAVSLDTLFAED